MSEIVDETCKWLREVVAVKQAELTAELTHLRSVSAGLVEAREADLRKAIDLAWGYAMQDGSVPSTKIQDKIMASVEQAAAIARANVQKTEGVSDPRFGTHENCCERKRWAFDEVDRLRSVNAGLVEAAKVMLTYFNDPDGGNPEYTIEIIRAAIASATGTTGIRP